MFAKLAMINSLSLRMEIVLLYKLETQNYH